MTGAEMGWKTLGFPILILLVVAAFAWLGFRLPGPPAELPETPVDQSVAAVDQEQATATPHRQWSSDQSVSAEPPMDGPMSVAQEHRFQRALDALSRDLERYENDWNVDLSTAHDSTYSAGGLLSSRSLSSYLSTTLAREMGWTEAKARASELPEVIGSWNVKVHQASCEAGSALTAAALAKVRVGAVDALTDVAAMEALSLAANEAGDALVTAPGPGATLYIRVSRGEDAVVDEVRSRLLRLIVERDADVRARLRRGP